MGFVRDARAPWLLVPCLLLTLSSVTLLAPRQAAQAAPPTPVLKPVASAIEAGDDGDGDELLEHWGDPKYSHEERLQAAGMAAAFLVLGAGAYRRRIRVQRKTMSWKAIETAQEAPAVVIEQRKAA